MLIDWVETLVPLAVAIVPTIVTVIKTARDTRASTNEKIDALDAKLCDHIRDYEDSVQKTRRVRILRFADDIAAGKRRSDEHWADAMEDIDNYEEYSATHPYYRNNKGILAIEYIKREYQKKRGVAYGEVDK